MLLIAYFTSGARVRKIDLASRGLGNYLHNTDNDHPGMADELIGHPSHSTNTLAEHTHLLVVVTGMVHVISPSKIAIRLEAGGSRLRYRSCVFRKACTDVERPSTPVRSKFLYKQQIAYILTINVQRCQAWNWASEQKAGEPRCASGGKRLYHLGRCVSGSRPLAMPDLRPDSVETSRRRLVILALVSVAYLLCYLDRMVMATAIPFIARDFEMTPVGMGGALSAFFAGYALMQLPGGILADRFGTRVIITIAVIWWSIMTLFTGFANTLWMLLVIRFLFGIGEGPYPSAASRALAVTFPDREIGRANSVLHAASAVGAVVAPLVVITLIEAYGWRLIFCLLFVPGVVLAVLSWLVLPSERAQVERHRHSTSFGEIRSNLYETLRTSAVFWGSAAALFVNMMNWGLLSWLPTYLLKMREFTIETMGVLTALGALAFAIGLSLGGYVCDRLFRSCLRRQMIIGIIGCATLIALGALIPNRGTAAACLIIAFLFMGINNVAMFTLPLVAVPPNSAGTSFGIVNTAGQVAGVASPLVIGFVIEISGSLTAALLALACFGLLGTIPALRIRQETLDIS